VIIKNNQRSDQHQQRKIKKVRHSRKTASLYLNTTIGELKNVLKLEHHTSIQTEQINYENLPRCI